MINANKFNAENFDVVFSNTVRAELTHYITGIELPRITVGAVPVYINNSKIEMPSNNFEKADLLIQFMLDEHWRSYGLLFAWLKGLKDNNEPQWNAWDRCDIRIPITDSNQSKEVAEFVMLNAWPLYLPELYLFHYDNDTDSINFPVPFKCDALLFNLKVELGDIAFYKDQENGL